MDFEKTTRRSFEKWLLYRLSVLQRNHLKNLEDKNWDLKKATKELTDFVFQTLSGEYLEVTKLFSKPQERAALQTLNFVFQQTLLMLFPFVPHLAAFLYRRLTKNQELTEVKQEVLTLRRPEDFWKIDCFFTIVRTVRRVVSKTKNLGTFYLNFPLSQKSKKKKEWNWNFLLEKLLPSTKFELLEKKEGEDLKTSLISEPLFPYGTIFYELPDQNEDLGELKKKIQEYEFEYQRSSKNLSNPSFLAKAPSLLVEKEKEKMTYYKNKKKEAEEQLQKQEKG